MRSSKRGAEVVWTLKSEVPTPSFRHLVLVKRVTGKSPIFAQHPVPHRQLPELLNTLATSPTSPEPWSLSTCLHKAVVPLVGVHAILGDMVDICRYGHMARMGQDCLRERLLATHRASTSHHR
jgi:hypothetical protein